MTKKLLGIGLLICILSILGAETNQTYTSGHYAFTIPESYTGIEETAGALNAFWNAFNEYFRFDPKATEGMNRVVILADKNAFDAYLKDRIGETRNQCVFLKYGKRELSELVLYPQSSASGFKAFEGPSLNRQLFLQYLYSFPINIFNIKSPAKKFMQFLPDPFLAPAFHAPCFHYNAMT